jgi:DNA-binding protein H-NS
LNFQDDPMTFDISGLSKSELIALAKRVERAIEAFDAQNLARARKEAQRVAREYGVSVEDLTGAAPPPASSKAKTKSKPKRRGKVAPKYRNPGDASQTWTGRGRQPAWVAEALAGGARLQDLAIVS